MTSFDEFFGRYILYSLNFQDYTGIYQDLYYEFRLIDEKASIIDDIVSELELVKQVEVKIDYILMLVSKYKDGNCKDKEILFSIDKAIRSSIELSLKK